MSNHELLICFMSNHELLFLTTSSYTSQRCYVEKISLNIIKQIKVCNVQYLKVCYHVKIMSFRNYELLILTSSNQKDYISQSLSCSQLQ